MIGSLVAKRLIKSSFDAFNRGDLEKFMGSWSEDCIFIYPGRVKAGGKFTGIPQVKKWFEDFLLQFPQRKFTVNHVGVDNIFDMTGNNTVFANVDLELVNKDGLKVINSAVSMIKIKRAKVVRVEDFLKVMDGDEYKKGWSDIG